MNQVRLSRASHCDIPQPSALCFKIKPASRAIVHLALVLCAPAVLAQAVDSGALLRQQQQAQPVPPPPTEGPKLEVPPPPPQRPLAQGEKSIFVSAFRLALPSALLNDAQLGTLLQSFTGHDNSVQDLQRATARVSDALRKRGYEFARVLLPQQEVVGGVVTLEIVPGKLALNDDGKPDIRVTTKGKTRINAQRAEETVASALPDPSALNTHALERGLLLLNDLPGVQGSGVLLPAQETGTLALGLDVQEGPLFGGSADVDNYGTRTTGADRLATDLHLNDVSGRGDVAELNLAKTLGTSSATASYTDPLGVSGLSSHLLASYLSYHVLHRFSAVDATGNSLWLSGGLSYPLLRTRNSNFYWTTSVDYKRLVDDAADIQIDSRRSEALSGGARGDHLFDDDKGSLSYSLTLTGGRLDRGGNAADEAQDALTRRSQGTYAILRTADSWLEQLNTRFSLSATVQMQFASRNLDTSEKMYMGGPHGVRAYPIEEAGSDQGQTLSFEARYLALNTAKWGGQLWTPFALLDAGHAMLNKDLWNGWNAAKPDLRNSYWLKGYGVGMRVQIARIVSLEIVEARKIGSNPGASATGKDADGLSDNGRLWFIAAVAF